MQDEPSFELRGRDLLGLGGFLVGSIVGCTAIGLLVDHVAGTKPAGVVVGVAAGIVFGFGGFILRVRRALRDPNK